MTREIQRAVDAIANSIYTVAFTGAGISVESGIPPFRGENGLWNRYDPNTLEIDYFLSYPEKSWLVIAEIIGFLDRVRPNAAHIALAELEQQGPLHCIITQNIDNLHQEAGSRTVYEFHGNAKRVICIRCGSEHPVSRETLAVLPPVCSDCGELLKPDFVFFGEPIPESAYRNSFAAAEKCDVLLVVGTTGEVMPAGLIPETAKATGATIIEFNVEPSLHTPRVSDIFIPGKATSTLPLVVDRIASKKRFSSPLRNQRRN